MKPSNLFIQGAKSGGKRKMRIRYNAHRVFGVRFFLLGAASIGKSFLKLALYFS